MNGLEYGKPNWKALSQEDIPDSGFVWLVLRNGEPIVAYPTLAQAENYYGPELQIIKIPLEPRPC